MAEGGEGQGNGSGRGIEEVQVTGTSCLCEGQPGLVVHFEDLLDGVDVGGRPQVQAQVVLGGRAHDLLQEVGVKADNQPINQSINSCETKDEINLIL